MDPILLRAAGTSVLLSFQSGEAEIVHWGADLGDTIPDLGALTQPVPLSSFDTPVSSGVIPQASSGWLGRRGLRGSRRDADGRVSGAFSPALRIVDAAVSDDGAAARITQADATAGLQTVTAIRLHPGGLLELTNAVENTASTPYMLDELAVMLPLSAQAVELLDLSGRWCRENHPQRQMLRQGTWVRSGRHGRTGHDSSLFVAAGTPGFGNRHGRVWATHFAWSGDHEQFVDVVTDGRATIGAAELLGSGELVLEPGERYETPALFAAFSDAGIDGITARYYDWFRARPGHPTSASERSAAKPRPVVLNTWEAVYFDHRIEPLIELAQSGAELGVERFVLDDGWFHGRRNDRAGLGDWTVDADVWPDGLTPLIDAVNSLGMEFGLWVEPEMINPDSDVARAHPDWIAGPVAPVQGGERRLPREWRAQQALDLSNPDAWQYVFDRLDDLLSTNRIAYLKWDQNRDSTELGHDGRPAVHSQTLAAYRLFDALRAAHPHVEIESCSSGGARVDLGILQRTDRVWASDCNDALERQTIQRWTEAVVPPELIGAHVGPRHAHTTGRDHDIAFRAITAMFGHFGIEWDVRQASAAERDVLARAIALYKEHRELLHSGVSVHADVADPNLTLHGVVAQDGSRGLFAAVALATLTAERPGFVGIPGLAPDRQYRVEVLLPAPATDAWDDAVLEVTTPPWVETPTTASGRFLAEVGLPLPVLRPERAMLFRAVAVEG
ncbi:alpha-galactosidase [Curtobacterium ammoniigenes]|uniref:alpha-galactosidase n=1 Tax=Curtobacterium ammoniigenes TaxID=395387 RepID=UPI000836693D|nr:alpha-galactosidase [Curtobacterium ammoniigenes]